MGKIIGWFSGKVTDITAAAGRALVISWGRKWADGKFGPTWTKIYYWLSTHAVGVSMTIGALAIFLETAAQMPGYLLLVGLSPEQVQKWVAAIAYAMPVLVSLKIATDQWHAIGHPDWLDSGFAKWMKDHAALLTYLTGGAFWYAENCHAGNWCAVERWAIFVVGVVEASMGIIPRADHSIPPVKVLQGLAGMIAPPTPQVAEQAIAIEQLPQAQAIQEHLATAAARQSIADEKPKAPQDATSVAVLKNVSKALDANTPA
jgi:hypothetical protein